MAGLEMHPYDSAEILLENIEDVDPEERQQQILEVIGHTLLSIAGSLRTIEEVMHG